MSTVDQLLRRLQDLEITQNNLQKQISDLVNERDRANHRIDALEQQLQPEGSRKRKQWHPIQQYNRTSDVEIIAIDVDEPEELGLEATARQIPETMHRSATPKVLETIPGPVLASAPPSQTNLPFFRSHFSKTDPALITELSRPFSTLPAIPDCQLLKRSLLASNYCKNSEIFTTQTFQGPLTGRRVLYFFEPSQGEAPTEPGMSGMFLAIEPDALFLDDDQWKSVFCSKLQESAEYLGEYMFRNLGTIPAELVAEGYTRGIGLRRLYGQMIREWPISSSFLALRARISLRNQNLTITQDILDAEVEAIKSRKGKALPHETRGAVRQAFESGDEKLYILNMTCVSYDHAFASEVFSQCSLEESATEDHKSHPNCDKSPQLSNKRPSSRSDELVDIRDSKRSRESSPETPSIIPSTQTVSTFHAVLDAILPPIQDSVTQSRPDQELLRSYIYKDKKALLLRVSQPLEIRSFGQHTLKEKSFADAYFGQGRLQLLQSLRTTLSEQEQDVVHVTESSQPESPQGPGEFGLLLVLNSDVQRLCDGISKAVFSGLNGKTCRYLGQYQLTDLGSLLAEQLSLVSSSHSQVIENWYQQIREWPTRPAIQIVRARISLQARGIAVTEEAVQREVKAIKARKGKTLPHESLAAIRNAFKSQSEV
ncbi:hypothetical protein C8J56DRAFT_1028433 [Mycena floridula]|nr:hypothetical protein C8J56DRAFT_1028433 [Mycena floridula]